MDFSMEYTREQEEFAQEVGAWLDENLPDDIEPAKNSSSSDYLTERRQHKFQGR